MKIEKISNTQIKVMLTKKDLADRNLKITEIAYGSEKTQELFREMMDEAIREFGFKAENVPLMIEAVPLGTDGIMLLVSKVDGDAPAETGVNMLPKALKERLFVKKHVEDLPEEISFGDCPVSIYSFENLDDVTSLCVHINGIYDGMSTLYKDKNIYYMAIASYGVNDMSADGFDALVSEFGTKHISNSVARAYLDEHAEVIIANKAVDVLGNL